ncbi:MAG TPA: glycerol-3-phosphate dehydrogenase/oxidase [Candidatus Limnocylindrales bacterium]
MREAARASAEVEQPVRAPVDARRATLGTLAGERYDVLVIGGGIVGAGAFLDASSRGLRAALVEQADIASGTSGRSSRLIHGGLRYLEQLHFGLVSEALAERSRLLRLAPHLVRLEPFLFPIYGIPLVHQGFYGAGIFLYDLLGARKDGGFARHLRPAGALEYAPDLKREGLTAGIVYHDGVEDDARLALTVVRTALACGTGSLAATRVRAEAPLVEAGRIVGATVRDLESGSTFELRAAKVIDATGVWVARPEERFAPDPGSAHVVPSRGSHVLIRRERLTAAGGMTLRIPGRVVFIIPWPDHWIIGTTDHLDERPPDHLSAPNEDVDELLATVNRTTHLDLTRADIVGTYAGMRPLVGGSGDSTVKTSREHKVTTDASGLVRIGGGKYTTYRVMARDAVDAALGRKEARRRPSATAELALLGAAAEADLDRLARALGGTSDGAEAVANTRLVRRHGTLAPEVLELGRALGLVADDGGPRSLGAGGHLAAEVPWAVRHELARSLDDVLARRMRLAQVMPDRGASIAPRVAELMGAELGWDPARQAREVRAYLENAAAEYGVPWPAT